ncbi:hypothetical protein [Massilia phosphatilytica]
MSTIVVFSHLRWDFVFQRPQHLLSRLAQHYPVLFVEEPVYDDGAPFMERSSPAPNVTVCRAHTPIHANGFHDDQLRLLQPMVAQPGTAGRGRRRLVLYADGAAAAAIAAARARRVRLHG